MRTLAIAGVLLAAASGTIVLARNNPAAPQAANAPQARQDPEAARAGDESELTREMFLEDEVAPRVEPAGYDATIVMYTDYQCPYCRKAHVALKQLVAQDPKLRILYRDWPIFGQASERAARLAIASKWQGRHAEFHDALMRTPGMLSEKTIRAAADKARLDWARLQQDLKAHGPEIEALLQRNNVQANALGLDGTPGFIIGTTFVPGGVDLAGFKELVKEARSEARAAKSKAAAGGR